MTSQITNRYGRAVLASAVATLAVTALPAVADAATVAFIENDNGVGSVSYVSHPNEVNNVRVGFTSAGIVIDDQVSITTLSSECRISSAGDAICPGTARSISVETRDRNDTITYAAPHAGSVSGGSGADTIHGGLRQAAFGRAIEPVFYEGHGGIDDLAVDTVSYRSASGGVNVRLDEVGSPLSTDDGRPGDLEGIFHDIEVIEGSNFNDTLRGTNHNETFRGLNGNDVIDAGGGTDLIDEGSAPNGADTLTGGNGVSDKITYGTRTSGVSVSLDGVRNDGATGEQDDVRSSVEHITGSNFADSLVGSSAANIIDGRSGPDTILGHENNDTIFAQDGLEDVVGCGSGIDTAQLDSRDGFGGCESTTIAQVGKLRLVPAAVEAKPGRPAHLRLSWSHPRSWRKLRGVELRLTDAGTRVGKIVIRPRAERVVAGGAVDLMRVRLRHKGKTVTARLALRFDTSLAGKTLSVEVEATDTRGRRQLERDAGTIRVVEKRMAASRASRPAASSLYIEPAMSRFWSSLALPAVLVAVASLAACGGTSRSQDPQPPREAQLLSVWRNFEETGIPEDMTIYADGEVEYRNLLHTQFGIRVINDHLAPARLTRIRRALDAVDLTEVDASNLKPRRSGFRYVIRSGGHVGTAVDGHLPAPIRPLVTELRAQMDRLQEKSLG